MSTFIWILVAEQEGDYGDFYQRPQNVLYWTDNENELQDFWNQLPIEVKNDVEFRVFEDCRYIDYFIQKLPLLPPT